MPVNVDVQIQRNASLKFPTVTICNKNMFNVTKFELLLTTPFVVQHNHHGGLNNNNTSNNVTTTTTGVKLLGRPVSSLSIGDVVGLKNMTAEAWWTSTAHDQKEMIVEVSIWWETYKRENDTSLYIHLCLLRRPNYFLIHIYT
jgi:hypothetical protein